MGRTLLVLIVLAIAVLVATGVIYVTRTNDTTTINFDETKLRQLGDKAKEEGREVIHKTGKAIERTGEKIQESPAANEPASPPAGEPIAPPPSQTPAPSTAPAATP